MMTGFVMLVVAMNTTMLVLALEERRMTASGCSYRMQLEIALGWTPILTVPIMCHQLLMLFCLRVMLEDQLQIPDLVLLLLEVGAVVSMLSPKTPTIDPLVDPDEPIPKRKRKSEITTGKATWIWWAADSYGTCIC